MLRAQMAYADSTARGAAESRALVRGAYQVELPGQEGPARMYALQTVGDGACALHAMFGEATGEGLRCRRARQLYLECVTFARDRGEFPASLEMLESMLWFEHVEAGLPHWESQSFPEDMLH